MNTSDLRLDIYLAVTKLSADDQQLFCLWSIGYTQEELAEQFNITQPTISRRLNDIKKFLRKELT